MFRAQIFKIEKEKKRKNQQEKTSWACLDKKCAISINKWTLQTPQLIQCESWQESDKIFTYLINNIKNKIFPRHWTGIEQCELKIIQLSTEKKKKNLQFLKRQRLRRAGDAHVRLDLVPSRSRHRSSERERERERMWIVWFFFSSRMEVNLWGMFVRCTECGIGRQIDTHICIRRGERRREW